MVIQHNMNATNATRQLGITAKLIDKSQEKLASGFKINRAADDAAGLSISEKMRKMIRGLNQGLKNTSDGISFIQIADGAMEEVHAMIHRLEELAIQSANGTNSESDRKAINDEVIEIKKEINRIGVTSKFNDQYIFEQKINPPAITITGSYFTLEDIDLFNIGYDSETQEAVYGGILLYGERISWEEIDPNMIKTDENGNKSFVAGEYDFGWNKNSYRITIQEGAKIPVFSKRNYFQGTLDTFYVNGKIVQASNFKNDKGESLSVDTIDTGRWTNKETGDYIDLVVSRTGWSYASLGDAVAAQRDGLLYDTNIYIIDSYAGGNTTKALSTTLTTKTPITSSTTLSSLLFKIESEGQIIYKLRADKEEDGPTDEDPDATVKHNGVWLEQYNADTEKWEEITGSLLSWEDVGLANEDSPLWNDGMTLSNEILNNTIYRYTNINNTNASIDFKLETPVTSLDSIIDGLNNVYITCDSLETNYNYSLSTHGSNIKESSIQYSSVPVDIETEYALNRDYSKQQVLGLRTASITVNDTTAELIFDSSASLSDKLKYTTAYSKISGTITDAIRAYVNKDSDAIVPLSSVVGAGNYTATGRQTETVIVKLDYGWKVTDGLNNAGGGIPLKNNQVCAGAYIDFKDVEDLNDLKNAGFDATCGFCDNHYSVIFTSGSGNYYDSLTDSNGNTLRYLLLSEEDPHYPDNIYKGHFLMKIDIDSLIDAGYTGETLASAMVDILSGELSYDDDNSSRALDGLDFHLTQYAAKDSKFYILNIQAFTEQVHANAVFNMEPYELFLPKPELNLNMTFTNEEGDDINIKIKYDYSYLEDAVITAPDADALEQIASDAINLALNQIIGNTEVSLNATDYTKSIWEHQENPNEAITSYFTTKITIGGGSEPKLVRIQHSGEKNDCTYIPKLTLNTFVLGLYNADCSTEENALKTIKMLDNALAAVSARRSLYGAIQNRLEHTYNNRANSMENLTNSESRIRDTDMAEEMVKYTSANLIAQASQAIIAQANHGNDYIIGLLTQ